MKRLRPWRAEKEAQYDGMIASSLAENEKGSEAK